jgi:hypothetical protein
MWHDSRAAPGRPIRLSPGHGQSLWYARMPGQKRSPPGCGCYEFKNSAVCSRNRDHVCYHRGVDVQRYRIVIEVSVPVADPYNPADTAVVMRELESIVAASPRFASVKAREGTTIAQEPDDYSDWRFHRGAYAFFGRQ